MAEAPEAELNLGRYGVVALESKIPNTDHAPRLAADAFFWQASREEGTGCEVVRTLGSCEITECIPVEMAAEPMPGFSWLSAGTVNIFGTKLDFSFTETPIGYEPTLPTREMALWDGGESLTASVAGSADFPAVEVSVTAPRKIMLTSPELSGAPLPVDPRADLTFAWSSPDVDSVSIEIEERPAQRDPAANEMFVRCTFSAEAGSGVVPAEVFDALSDPATLSGYRFQVTTDSRAEVEVGGAAFTFFAWAESQRFEATILEPGAGRSPEASDAVLDAGRGRVGAPGMR